MQYIALETDQALAKAGITLPVDEVRKRPSSVTGHHPQPHKEGIVIYNFVSVISKGSYSFVTTLNIITFFDFYNPAQKLTIKLFFAFSSLGPTLRIFRSYFVINIVNMLGMFV